MKVKIKRRLVCPCCGGRNIMSQANAWWDENLQEWRYAMLDGADDFCNDCDTYVIGRFVDLTEESIDD